MLPPTFVGVLPFQFLSRTVDSTYTEFAGVAPAVLAATVVGPVVERSRSRARLTFRGRPSPGCVCLNFQTVLGGGVEGWFLGPVSVESPNYGECEIGKDSVELEDSLAVELEEENWDVEKDVENWDVEKDVETKLTSLDAYATKCRAAGAGPPTPSPSIMTADAGLETQRSAGVEVIGPPAAWQFDFGNSFGDSFGGLTDEDRVTSMASKETLAWPSRGDKQEMGSYGVHGDAQRESL